MKSRDPLELLASRGNEVQGIDLGLDRILCVLRALGDPQLRFPSLHIAGTNGKGSVAAMAESILREEGYRTALYTSPHLVRVEERIRTQGRAISRPGLSRLIERAALTEAALLNAGSIDRRLTYFELITACAFLHFAQQRIEVAVVEVGLGGALDATNVVVPAACVITGVSMDHEAILGRTIARIAREKAGIVKPGAGVFSGCDVPEAQHVIRTVARRLGAPLAELGSQIRISEVSVSGGRFSMNLRTPRRTYSRLRPALSGRHQLRNAALAVAAVESLEGFPVKVAAVRRGLASARWPGRLELFRRPRRTLLDGAHNLEGANALAAHLPVLSAGPIHLVFGVLGDKDIRGIGRALFPLADRLYLARLTNGRSADPEAVLASVPAIRRRTATYGSACSALRAAWRDCPTEGLVVVAGSLYLLGEVLPMIRRAQPRVRAGKQRM